MSHAWTFAERLVVSVLTKEAVCEWTHTANAATVRKAERSEPVGMAQETICFITICFIKEYIK